MERLRGDPAHLRGHDAVHERALGARQAGHPGRQPLLGDNLEAWGWLYLIVGVVLVVIGVFIFRRASWAVLAGIGVAFLGAMVNLFWIFSYPLVGRPRHHALSAGRLRADDVLAGGRGLLAGAATTHRLASGWARALLSYRTTAFAPRPNGSWPARRAAARSCSRSTRARPRPSTSWSRARRSTRGCSTTSRPPRHRCTSTSSASGPASSDDRFADALIAKAAEGVPVRLVVDRQGSDRGARRPSTTASPLGSRCVVRATFASPPGRWRPAARTSGTSAASGTSTIASSWSWTVASAGSGERDRGPFPGRPLPRCLSPRRRPGGGAAPARLHRELPRLRG